MDKVSILWHVSEIFFCEWLMGRPVLMLLMFLKLVKSKRGTYDKLISMLLRFIADKGPDFSLAFRILNVDIYSFPIRITIKNCPEKPLTQKA